MRCHKGNVQWEDVTVGLKRMRRQGYKHSLGVISTEFKATGMHELLRRQNEKGPEDELLSQGVWP